MERRLIIYFILILCTWTEAIEETSTVATPSTITSDSKSAQETGPAKSSLDSKTANDGLLSDIPAAMTTKQKERPIELKEKPAHITQHSRHSQDARPLYTPDIMVEVAGPGETTQIPHLGTEVPSDVMPPAKSKGDDMPQSLIFKRLQANSTSTSNDLSSPAPTVVAAKTIRKISEDVFSSETDLQPLKSSKREIQNVANLIVSTTNQLIDNIKDEQSKPKTPVEHPKCPTLASFINATENLWNGLKSSDGIQTGLFSLYSAVSASVAALARCGKRLLGDIGIYLSQLNSNGSKQDEMTVAASTNPGSKIITKINKVNTEKGERVNFDADLSVIPTTNTKTDFDLPTNRIMDSNPSDKVRVETNASKTELLESNEVNPVAIETNLTRSDLVDLSSTNPVVVETNVTKTEVVDPNPSKAANMETNISNEELKDTFKSANTLVGDSNQMKYVTENVQVTTPNKFTVNVYSINKHQDNPPLITHVSQVDKLKDYDYDDNSTDSFTNPVNMINKIKRVGRGNGQWRKRTAKSGVKKQNRA